MRQEIENLINQLKEQELELQEQLKKEKELNFKARLEGELSAIRYNRMKLEEIVKRSQ
jgi:adenylosuccinate lyase